MANKNDKQKENVPGRFYVDKECIGCDTCIMSAEGNFAMEDDEGHAYVKKQPQTPEEIEQCLEALEGCPVEAIGEDGEE